MTCMHSSAHQRRAKYTIRQCKTAKPGKRSLILRHIEELGLHVQLAELGYAACELEIGLHSFQDPHVGEADFFDELEFGVFG